MNTENALIRTLEHAMNPIVNEMFKNGFEEGCRIWENPNHPLQQAIQILLRAKISIFESTAECLALSEELKKGEPSAAFLGKLSIL